MSVNKGLKEVSAWKWVVFVDFATSNYAHIALFRRLPSPFSIVVFHRNQSHGLFNDFIGGSRVAVDLRLEQIGDMECCIDWIICLSMMDFRCILADRWLSWSFGASNLLCSSIYMVLIEVCNLEGYLWLFVMLIDYWRIRGFHEVRLVVATSVLVY